MTQMIRWVVNELPAEKPRHLLGIGHLEDIPGIIREGVDLFDCIVPTQYARRGVAFTSQGKLNIGRSIFLKDKKTLDPHCECAVCASYSRGYLSHLMRAKEILPLGLLTFHNLFYFNAVVKNLREKIGKGSTEKSVLI
jgi:tRNA-guanine family transglycosylase